MAGTKCSRDRAVSKKVKEMGKSYMLCRTWSDLWIWLRVKWDDVRRFWTRKEHHLISIFSRQRWLFQGRPKRGGCRSASEEWWRTVSGGGRGGGEKQMNSEALCPKHRLFHEAFLAESSLSCLGSPHSTGTFMMALTFLFMAIWSFTCVS